MIYNQKDVFKNVLFFARLLLLRKSWNFLSLIIGETDVLKQDVKHYILQMFR